MLVCNVGRHLAEHLMMHTPGDTWDEGSSTCICPGLPSVVRSDRRMQGRMDKHPMGCWAQRSSDVCAQGMADARMAPRSGGVKVAGAVDEGG